MVKRIEYLKKAIIKYSLRLDHKGYVANHDGNLSIRVAEGFLCTPTAEAKVAITEEMVLTLDREGNKVEGIGKPFSELKLHLAAYRARPDVMAVVHAHPPFATAHGLVHAGLTPRLPEAIVSIGDHVPVVPYTLPGTSEHERGVENALQTADVFYMAGNGVLAVGKDIEQAYLRLELVEHLTQIEHIALQMGAPLGLPTADIAALMEKRRAAGLGPRAIALVPPQSSQAASPPPPQDKDNKNIRGIIAAEIKRALKDLS